MSLHQANKEAILKSYFDTSGFGIEIGPQARGLVPKRAGYNVKIADWCSAQHLRELYKSDPAVDETKIEDVDYVTGGKSLAEAVPERGVFDFIIASHVIEHIPDLVQFLKDCEGLLRPSGRLVLAVPDKRFQFDVFRPLTWLGDLCRRTSTVRVDIPLERFWIFMHTPRAEKEAVTFGARNIRHLSNSSILCRRPGKNTRKR
ncbi:MAG: class I SAM-dependent methyltransferase [Steroidobacteraceae bacterium]